MLAKPPVPYNIYSQNSNFMSTVLWVITGFSIVSLMWKLKALVEAFNQWPEDKIFANHRLKLYR